MDDKIVSIQEVLERMLEHEVYVEELGGVSVYGYLMAFDDRFLILSQAEIFGRKARVIVDTIFINREYVGSICAGVEGITVSNLKKGKVITLTDLVKAQAKVTVQTKRGEMVEGTIIGVFPYTFKKPISYQVNKCRSCSASILRNSSVR